MERNQELKKKHSIARTHIHMCARERREQFQGAAMHLMDRFIDLLFYADNSITSIRTDNDVYASIWSFRSRNFSHRID